MVTLSHSGTSEAAYNCVPLYTDQSRTCNAFALAELCVAVAVCAVFAAAAFATNQRLLMSLKAQKETTAATMMLQERMESFRATAYSSVANYNYVLTNVVQKPTTSEAALGGLNAFSETITVSGSQAAPSYSPSPSTDFNQWVRNSQYPNGNGINENDNLATNYNLLQVDILISWTSTDGRSRTRDLTAVFGKGNIGQ